MTRDDIGTIFMLFTSLDYLVLNTFALDGVKTWVDSWVNMSSLGVGRDIFRMKKKSKFNRHHDTMRMGLIYKILVWTSSP